MSENIRNVIDTLNKNIGILKGVRELNSEDIVMLFVELFGSLKDMWTKFQDVFARIEEITEMEKQEEKENDPMNEDVGSLYL